MEPSRSRYRTRAVGGDEARAAPALRGRQIGGVGQARDADDFDAEAPHVLVEDTWTGNTVCRYRMTAFGSGGGIGRSRAARFHDPEGLSRFEGPILEIGRFCVEAGTRDPDVLRVAWGALRAHVDAEGIEMLFGCPSFLGADAAPCRDAFALLRERHPAPARRASGREAPAVVRFARRLAPAEIGAALRGMPPLLRRCLRTVGRVPDHPVTDRVPRDVARVHRA